MFWQVYLDYVNMPHVLNKLYIIRSVAGKCTGKINRVLEKIFRKMVFTMLCWIIAMLLN